MKVFAQMDDIFSIDITTDSTFSLLLEAQKNKHQIYYYLPQDLTIEGNEVNAYIHEIKLQNEINNHCQIIKSQFMTLDQADIILFRQDPPFNIDYVTSSYALEKVKDKVLIVNDPTEVRNCPEKIFVTDFEEISPPTIITSNLEQAISFKERHQDIIIKPLHHSGGEGILHLKAEDGNLDVLFEMMIKLYKSPFIVQKYLKEVKNGNKRILLLDGEPIGAINLIAKEGEVRTNLHVGGTPYKSNLTEKETEICKIIGIELKKRGLIFAGIDVIGDYVTEINVTSPGCIQEISQLNGIDIAKIIWEYLEKKAQI